MNIKPIKIDIDYREALKEVESLMTVEPNTPEGEKLDILVALIEAYERKHFPLDLSEPVEAIKFEMAQKDLTIKDLEPIELVTLIEVDECKEFSIDTESH